MTEDARRALEALLSALQSVSAAVRQSAASIDQLKPRTCFMVGVAWAQADATAELLRSDLLASGTRPED